jgi:hypothetical protein
MRRAISPRSSSACRCASASRPMTKLRLLVPGLSVTAIVDTIGAKDELDK